MSASGAETSTQLPPPAARVFFQAAPTGGRVGTGPATKDDSVQKKNGKVTVKYDRKELRKRLILEEWIIEQLSELYDCEDEEMPEVEIDIDDILDATSEDERAIKLQTPATRKTGIAGRLLQTNRGIHQRAVVTDKRDEKIKCSSEKGFIMDNIHSSSSHN
ncbi:protein phosphatase 1 regulatory subunit 14B-like isoform X1 [Polyodon spathula]|uniref:protein phosphatase 1 regulatory subunit 14B-like isoform X1 n=1 Tax=Polyodon spathula TaxID=7913 RepID=UPI001B7DE3A9|nr:protein phosphatase 1 regulatory subunit 14B-like isoform X1 [Polyodon spathula]